MGMYHSNCWIWAVLQWVSLGGRLRMYRAGAGWVPRMAWSFDGETWWRFEPDSRVRYATLPWWRKVLPYHVLWYAGHVVQDFGPPRM